MSGSDGLIPFLSSLEEEIWGGNNRQVSWLMARAPLAPFPGFPSGLDQRLANHSGGSARDSHPLPLAATKRSCGARRWYV